MESQLDSSDTRSDSSSHNFIIWISIIAMTDQTCQNHAKDKFYDFALRRGESSAKAEEKKIVWMSFTDGPEGPAMQYVEQ